MHNQQRFPPDDPREWIRRAFSDLALAMSVPEGVVYEDLCYHAQQAAEKALKAILIRRNEAIPYVHDLTLLLVQIGLPGTAIPLEVQRAVSLTRFAVTTRYPGLYAELTETDYRDAVQSATSVVHWAASVVEDERARRNVDESSADFEP